MKRGIFGALLVLAVLFAACGGGDPAPATTTATRPTGSPATTAAATSATSSNPTDPEVFAKRKLPLDLAKGTALGKADAKVTLEVFEDFQCPFCLAFTMALEPTVVDDYVATGKVLLVFRNFPILGKESVSAGLAATCAAAQDKFWPLHHRLFLEQARAGQLQKEQLNAGRFADDRLIALATEVGLSAAPFTACLKDEATLAKLQDEVVKARGLGLSGTPSLVINGKPIATPSNVTGLKKLLDDAVAAAK